MRDVILSLMLPRGIRCLICGEARKMDGKNALCRKCRDRLRDVRIPAASCERCKGYVEAGGVCRFCKSGGMEHIVSAYAPFMYTGAARTLVMQLKFRDMDDGLAYLTDAMADALPVRDFDLIVPVPLHARRERQRGCNQAQLLAQGVGVRINVPVVAALMRVRATSPQSRLSSLRARRSNVENAFAIREDADISGKKILLVDDVRTSGSTARACAKALLQGGAREVHLLCACVVWHYKGNEKNGSVAGKNGAAAGQ